MGDLVFTKISGYGVAQPQRQPETSFGEATPLLQLTLFRLPWQRKCAHNQATDCAAAEQIFDDEFVGGVIGVGGHGGNPRRSVVGWG